MKTNQKKELHLKTIAELTKQLKQAREEQRVLKLDQQMGKIKNTSSINVKRVEIAEIKTIINEKLVEGKVEAPAEQLKKEVLAKEKSANKKTVSVKTTTVKGGKKNE